MEEVVGSIPTSSTTASTQGASGRVMAPSPGADGLLRLEGLEEDGAPRWGFVLVEGTQATLDLNAALNELEEAWADASQHRREDA